MTCQRCPDDRSAESPCRFCGEVNRAFPHFIGSFEISDAKAAWLGISDDLYIGPAATVREVIDDPAFEKVFAALWSVDDAEAQAMLCALIRAASTRRRSWRHRARSHELRRM